MASSKVFFIIVITVLYNVAQDQSYRASADKDIQGLDLGRERGGMNGKSHVLHIAREPIGFEMSIRSVLILTVFR